MFIKKIEIKNFRLFQEFEVDNINKPNGTKNGSGLTLFVGENGLGKTSLLDAFTLPILEYKTEGFSIDDLNNIDEKCEISIYSHNDFDYKGTMPKVNYKGKGFQFIGGLRSRGTTSYLDSIITTDQKFIRADGEIKPKDNAPDLRVSVNNPWAGKRFSENDFLYLDKNRTYQIRSGTYNTTRFDRLIEDLDYQYLKSEGKDSSGTVIIDDYKNIDNRLHDIKDLVENSFLNNAISKFQDISNYEVKLFYMDNYLPHKKSFFAIKKDNGQQIKLSKIGSGYEMIFSLIYSFYLAKQSGKDLIILIDEPELHLHPKLQEKFVELLLEFSKESQIILTSHSPLLVKQLLENDFVKTYVLRKDSNEQIIASETLGRVLPYLSANEINFVAFDLATEEYHNELYNELENNFWSNNDFRQIKRDNGYPNNTSKQVVFDNEFFVNKKGDSKSSPWKGEGNKVSIHTFIRNQIHHRAENGKPDYNNIKSSIEKMREFLQNLSNQN